jgi:hypothetical protein
MVGAGEMGCAGEWEELENGRRWITGGAGELEVLENGWRWNVFCMGYPSKCSTFFIYQFEDKGLTS